MINSWGSGSSPLAGKRVLVVGTGKMGVAAAAHARAHGAEVTLSSRSEQRLAEVGPALPGVMLVAADPEDAEQAVDLLERLQPLDHVAVLAGGASVSRAYGIANTPAGEAQRSFARFWLSYHLLQAAGGRIRPGGSVTLLSGSSSRRPSDGRGFWGTLHGAIEALGRNAAFELAPVRVNTVSPGGIGVTPMNRQLVPHRGQPDDVAAMVVSLMGNPAVTGTVVDVDGGEFLGTFE
ncbi:SDR family oxidoreductase [Micromonospora sp. NPDC000663]|uniref:SDR family oxidoreductase n=1 Tax=Micromonospora sp. NPDC000663 TaxID=3364218 RepID=UPI00367B67A9